MWDVPWEEILALELAKAGFPMPSHLIIHLKNFRRSENFVRVIKCNTEESSEGEPQARRICFAVCKFWKGKDSDTRNQMSKVSNSTFIVCLLGSNGTICHRILSWLVQVPSSQRHCFTRDEAGGSHPRMLLKSVIKSTELSLSGSASDDRKLVTHTMNFSKVWSSEQESKGRCTLCQKQVNHSTLENNFYRF